MAPEDSIAAALVAVTTKNVSVRAAALEFNVARNTLAGRLKNGNKNRVEAHEGTMKLSLCQEDFLVNWAWMEDSCGRAPRHADVKKMAEAILNFSSTDRHDLELGNKWLSRFLARHPDIATMKGRKLAAIRQKGTTYSTVSQFFEDYKSLLAKYDFQNSNIWNMDETGFALGVTSNRNVIAPSFKRRTFVKSPENRDHVTVFECISALGKCIEPLVIFKGKDCLLRNFPPDISYGHYYATKNGWTDNYTAMKWLQSVFIPQTKPSNSDAYQLLIMDGHLTHCTLDFTACCSANKVIPLILPPHASHVLQPLDVAVFSSMKSAYRQAVVSLSRKLDVDHISKANFLQCYQVARPLGLSERNIKAGFKNAGLWPVNSNKVLGSHWVTESPTPPRPSPQKVLQDESAAEDNSSRNLRNITRQHKIEKDKLIAAMAFDKERILSLEAQLAEAKQKTQCRTPVKKTNSSQDFITIVDVEKAREEEVEKLKKKEERAQKKATKVQRQAEVPSRKRGRPRKILLRDDDENTGESTQRKRGRPRKNPM